MSFFFQCLVTLVLLSSNSVESLIVYVTAVEALFILCSVAGLLWLRYTQPGLSRPIRVNLLLPIAFLVICTSLVVFSAIHKPMEIGIGIAFIALGVPVFYVFIMWKNKPMWIQNTCNSFNTFCSKLFLCVPEDSKDLWSRGLLIWVNVTCLCIYFYLLWACGHNVLICCINLSLKYAMNFISDSKIIINFVYNVFIFLSNPESYGFPYPRINTNYFLGRFIIFFKKIISIEH